MKLLDSNLFIGEAARAGTPPIPFFFQDEFCYSIITRIEVLGFSRITPQEKDKLHVLLEAGEQLPLTLRIAPEAIELRQAHRMDLGDAIIAATALVHELPLVTHNLADFRHNAGLDLLPA